MLPPSESFGWVGRSSANARELLAAMSTPANAASFDAECGQRFGMGSAGPKDTAVLLRRNGFVAALHGHPEWRAASGESRRGLADVAAALLDAFADRGVDALSGLRGDFAVALLDVARTRLVLAVDRMAVRNLVYARTSDGIVFGTTCDALLRHGGLHAEVDPQSLYSYIYFHMVPAPRTIYRDWRRVAAGHHVVWEDGTCREHAHWQPQFDEDADAPFVARKREFRQILERSVRTLSDGARCGSFLSGGTDSSTIAGLLGSASGTPAQTFSIGFDAAGFDEMHYARIAAKHFATAHHEYYVTPQDVVDAIPRIADAYDQPFGNASAVPTYHCALLAQRHGIARMLGGDGGDELFGGNSRYAKQQQLARYDLVPRPLRAFVEPLAKRLPLTERSALMRRTRSYVAQASMPMPDRYESYNLLERLGPANVFDGDFLASVDPTAPLRHIRDVYARTNARSLINRMLALDFEFTLADNDLPKVTRMCELAGIDVAFPMLSDDLVDYSLRLAPNEKLRGTRLRYFFKKALRDFLPAEILAKTKHGFGLPVGTWLQSYRPLHSLAADSLASLRSRRIVRAGFIDQLLDEHLASHAEYYGAMIWVLMMLELWFQRHAGGAAR